MQDFSAFYFCLDRSLDEVGPTLVAFEVARGPVGRSRPVSGLRRQIRRNSAARIRISAPDASRADTSRESTAARYSSWVHDDYLACSASRAVASRMRLAHAGA